MRPDPIQRRHGDPFGAAVKVELEPARAPGFAAIVHLVGEHDVGTKSGIEGALQPIVGDVLVDLSACEFIDSSVLSTFVMDWRARSASGHRLELAVPESNRMIVRTLKVSGLTEVLTVHATPVAD
jgi:anti-anti-sigma factor